MTIRNKDLVYFVIGGKPEYARLLEFCLNTLRGFADNDAYDTLVICDESYKPHVVDLPVTFIHVCEPNANHVQASMRKVELFAWPGVTDYNRALYLDCDIVVDGSLAPVFDAVKLDDTLYVVNESLSHKECYFQCLDTPYSPTDLAEFERNGIKPFNAGQFAFAISEPMRHHFEAVRARIARGYDANLHFYEQSFLNDHFNRAGKADNALNAHVMLFAQRLAQQSNLNPKVIIAHFCDVGASSNTKLEAMRAYHAQTAPEISLRDSRALIALAARPLPCRPSVAEIGTFRGDFAATLLDQLRPSCLTLVDPWAGDVVSGDQDGNDVRVYRGEDLYNTVAGRFAAEIASGKVRMIRKFSNQVTSDEIPRQSLDLLYIDGDHSYEGVKSDLQLALEWVRPGGWICGHDYEMNMTKTRNVYDFGVKRAVDEFCNSHGFRVRALLRDGCVSFAIRR